MTGQIQLPSSRAPIAPPIAPVAAGPRPVQAKRERRAQKAGVKYLTESQLERFFAQIQSARDKAIFRLIVHRGLRASEIGLIQFSDWDQREGTLYIHRLKNSLSGNYRLIPAEAIALRAYLKNVRGTAAGPMFLSRNHSPISRDRLDELMKRYCAAAGIPKDLAHCHTLKHTCGTHLLKRLGDIMIVKDWLGHRKIENTLIYAAVVNESRDRATQKVSDWGKK